MIKNAKRLGVMLDCSRGAVYTVEALKKYMDVLAKMGYNSLQLYTEDTYEIKNEPYFGYMRGRYSADELRQLDCYAASKGIELIPCIQTLAHLSGALRWPEYFSCTDVNDILLAEDERTYVLIENMFRTCSECFQSRNINIGMDEAHMVGLGKYLDLHGYKSRYEILIKHLERVCEIADKYGFKPMMWSDMFFRLANHGEYYVTHNSAHMPKINIPKNLRLIYWDYYSLDYDHYDRMINAHRQMGAEPVFAGGAWTWTGFVPHNEFSMEANSAALKACNANGVNDVIITVWKDDGSESSLWSNLPSLWSAAENARGNFDKEDIEDKFYKIFKISMADFLLLDAPENAFEKSYLHNEAKYMLYNDLFLGIFDKTVSSAEQERFGKLAEQLKTVSAGKYGYVFRTIADLCAVLEKKYALGVQMREAYRAKDKEGLKKVLEDLKETERRVARFARSFEAQWMKECKPFGFEKHDIRLGGLIYRLAHCRRVLEDYLRGKREVIEELEEDILTCDSATQEGRPIAYNDWMSIAMIKPRN